MLASVHIPRCDDSDALVSLSVVQEKSTNFLAYTHLHEFFMLCMMKSALCSAGSHITSCQGMLFRRRHSWPKTDSSSSGEEVSLSDQDNSSANVDLRPSAGGSKSSASDSLSIAKVHRAMVRCFL